MKKVLIALTMLGVAAFASVAQAHDHPMIGAITMDGMVTTDGIINRISIIIIVMCF
jgi:hypothetical protein